MASRRRVVVFLLICASCVATVVYLDWSAAVQRRVALAAIDAMHRQHSLGVKGFWPIYQAVETTSPFRTVVYIKGLTAFADGFCNGEV